MPRGPGDTVATGAIEVADTLLADGRWREAVDVLTAANDRDRDGDVERRLTEVRHLAFEHLRDRPGDRIAWPPSADDLFPDVVGPPEVHVTDLTLEHLRSGIAHHGCLLVRGLVSPDRVDQLIAGIDRAFDGYDAFEDGSTADETSPWFVPLDTMPEFEMQRIETMMLRATGGVHTGDSPRVLFELLEAFGEAGVLELISAHLGETPVISLNKGVLRKVLEANPTWHQDGCYLGEDIRALNLWMALTDCGGDSAAPGLDMVPTRIGRLLPGGTHGAMHPQAIGHPVVEEAAGGVEWVRPDFAAGDAVLFDQVFVHSTDKRKGLTTLRYAIETWFFTPSTFPDNQIPIVV